MPNISLYFVRHGQRIDQIDPSWATTSPCPQDPPLTQLGKLQARQTGTMIRDFAHESSSSLLSPPVSISYAGGHEVKMVKVSVPEIQTENGSGGGNKDEEGSAPQQQGGQGGGGGGGGHSDNEASITGTTTTVQRMTPPESPDFSRVPLSTTETTSPLNQDTTSRASSTQQGQEQDEGRATRRVSGPSTFSSSSSHVNSNNNSSSSSRSKRRPHHFAIVTSPFLRCSQTAIEMAIGMRSLPTTVKSLSGTTGVAETNPQQQQQQEDGDVVTIAVETGLSGKLKQNGKQFAMSRRDHEQYYTIDWKYQAKDRSLPAWPETREDMQARLERSLAHILDTYTGAGTSNSKYKDHDLSIVFVTHASAVNALLEACLETPILVPVPNCSISRCRWTSFSSTDITTTTGQEHNTSVLVQSTSTQTIAGQDGRWLLDYQTHTRHLDRDRR
ncbi:hypothetical protein BGZ88_011483 [Linnemannia elongata]|nr:hypothetical protein BGZ88_011483 [Linnemannia elongata]